MRRVLFLTLTVALMVCFQGPVHGQPSSLSLQLVPVGENRVLIGNANVAVPHGLPGIDRLGLVPVNFPVASGPDMKEGSLPHIGGPDGVEDRTFMDLEGIIMCSGRFAYFQHDPDRRVVLEVEKDWSVVDHLITARGPSPDGMIAVDFNGEHLPEDIPAVHVSFGKSLNDPAPQEDTIDLVAGRTSTIMFRLSKRDMNWMSSAYVSAANLEGIPAAHGEAQYRLDLDVEKVPPFIISIDRVRVEFHPSSK